MNRAFEETLEYVKFLTDLPFSTGEQLCLSYLPSAFFPKDAVQRYFGVFDPVADGEIVTQRLWSYGRTVLRSLESGQSQMCVELQALRQLCSEGTVHPVTPRFELGFAVRIQVLKAIKKIAANGSLSFVPEPVPFTFRLHPPDGVLIDVRNNISNQRIQGIWLEDTAMFSSFSKEFTRLRLIGGWRGTTLTDGVEAAVRELTQGRPCSWPP